MISLLTREEVRVDAGNGYTATARPAELGQVSISITRVADVDPDNLIGLPQISVVGVIHPGGLWLWSESVPDRLWHAVHKAAWMVHNNF